MTCSQVIEGLVLSIWNNAGDGINSLLNQPLKVKQVGAKKILAKIINTSQYGDEYEVRGRDLYLAGGNIILQVGIPSDGSITSCLDGQSTSFEYDTSFATPQFYWKDNTVYKPFRKPTVLSTSFNVNTPINCETFQDGYIKVFKNNIQLSISDIQTANKKFSFTPTESGDYSFVLYNSNGISDKSQSVSVSSTELKFDYIVPAISQCELEFGVSPQDKDKSVVYYPSQGDIRLNSNGDVVETGGKIYKHKIFNLAKGKWFFYIKEKGNETNIKIISKTFV